MLIWNRIELKSNKQKINYSYRHQVKKEFDYFEKSSHSKAESVVFINDNFYILVTDRVVIFRRCVSGSHNFMIVIHLHEHNFPEHKVVMDENYD